MARDGGGEARKALREAAERIEQGIERYAAGDVAASVREFEEALAKVPGHPRALACLAWVRDLQAGKRTIAKKGEVDAEAVQQVTDALADGPGFESTDLPEETTRRRKLEELQKSKEEETESPWDPVPLTPEPRPVPGEPASAPERPIASSPPPAAPAGSPVSLQALAKNAPRPPSSSPTLLGVGDFQGPLLTPTPRPSPLYHKEENTGAQTREFRVGGTNPNLAPLDVPELTDEQLHALAGLDQPPELSPGEAVAAVVEMEAEPTPQPHLNPLKRDQTTPDSALLALDDSLRLGSGEFDALEQTPTRDRGQLLRAVAEYDAAPASAAEDELQLPPLTNRDFAEESGTGTNPFIRNRTNAPTGRFPPPRLEDLPPAPGRDTSESPALDPPPVIQEALDRGDLAAAVDASERFIAEGGGFDSELVKKQHWLMSMVYEAVIGSLDRVPAHGQVTPDLDPRSAFLLSRLDGMTSADDLLDVSGMPRLEAMRILALLVRRGIVVMK